MAWHAWSALLWVMVGVGAVLGQTTAFTYQGQLTDAGQPANGAFDLQFALFGAANAGTQIGSTQTVAAEPVSGGVFTVQLDFGVSAFPGADRFLQIGVRPAGGGSYTTLAPRQQISASPYAIRTLSAATADALSSTCVGCVQNTQINSVAGSKLTGTIPVASLPTGSGNYVQNTTTPQAGANFNIGGNGTVGGNLTVAGTLNANVSGNFIQNRTTQQANASFDISGNGTAGQTLAAKSVGVGTTVPASSLDVRGTGWFDGDSTPLPSSAGKGVAVGFGSFGYLFAFDYGSFSPQNLVLNSPGGNIGIGTTTPTAKLEVDGGNGDAVHGISTGGGRGVWGESNSWQGVYGKSMTNAGVVGEAQSFHGVFGVSHNANAGGVYGSDDAGGSGVVGTTNAGHSTTQAGVYGTATGNGGVGVLGQANTGSTWAVAGITSSSTGVGVYGQNTAGGRAMYAEGHVGQARDKGGWVKAMIYVQNYSGTIERCYNAFLGGSAASSPPCGFSASSDSHTFTVDFGFQVDDRFVLLSPVASFGGITVNSYIVAINGSTVFVHSDTTDTGCLDNDSDCGFLPIQAPIALVVF